MKILEGLFDNMVLQRNRRNRSDAAFTGESRADGIVTVRATRRGRALAGWNGAAAGHAARGKLGGRIRGLPAGGPYDIEITVTNADRQTLDSKRIRNVLVGDVWLLAGQSNMEGVGYLKDAAKPHPMVRAFFMDDRWGVAKDPIHNLSQAVDPVHPDISGGPPQRDRHAGVGPGVAFGQEMHRRTGVPQGLIPCAHGGTSMTQWDPAGKSLGSHSLYGAMLRRLRKNGGRAAGLVWSQGCSEVTAADAPLYTGRMKALARAVRRDIGDPRLPIVAVQISRALLVGASDAKWWNSIQDQQRRLPDAIPRFFVAPTIDLELDDMIHISGKDQNRLGARLAQAMRVLRGDRKAGKPPIRLKSVTVEKNPLNGWKVIRVKFENVMGRLRTGDRPNGFDLVEGQPLSRIYRIDLERNAAVIRTRLEAGEAPGAMLYYGYGAVPYCNITDAADRSLPAFGPIEPAKT